MALPPLTATATVSDWRVVMPVEDGVTVTVGVSGADTVRTTADEVTGL